MPIFRTKNHIVFFAHIPKCGGTSIERAFINSGFQSSFLDGRFWKREKDCWYRSSPQHITSLYLNRLFGDGFFDYEFSVVRDPLERFLSAFNHHRRRIGRHVSLDRFLFLLERRIKKSDDFFGYKFDNHFLPSSRFLRDETNVFYLEDGLEFCISSLNKNFSINLDPPEKQNSRKYDLKFSNGLVKSIVNRFFFYESPRVADLSDDQVERIKRLYEEDYKRFPRYISGFDEK